MYIARPSGPSSRNPARIISERTASCARAGERKMARHERSRRRGFSRSCTAHMAMPRCARVTEPPGPQFAMQNWIDIHYTSRDGLRLYARHYPVPGSLLRPVVCLAGLTRNCRDFHDLATALATAGRDRTATSTPSTAADADARRTMPNWKNYSILIELNDVLDFMTMKGLDRAAVIGTSRGGLIAMLMARAAAQCDGRRGAERHRARDRARGPMPASSPMSAACRSRTTGRRRPSSSPR